MKHACRWYFVGYPVLFAIVCPVLLLAFQADTVVRNRTLLVYLTIVFVVRINTLVYGSTGGSYSPLQ